MSRLQHWHFAHSARSALVLGALALATSAHARADTPVDTEYQHHGITPRLEFELGPQFAWGLGHACRNDPVASGAAAKTSCESSLPLLGGEAVMIVRPVRHWGIGAFFAYDIVMGTHEVYIDKEATKLASYQRTAQRLGVQLRWYSRSVSTSGFYFALHAGALWWSDKVKPLTDDNLTQLAPEYGFELGGVFAPYHGLGITLALQSWMMWLQDSAQRTTSSYGSTYGYGPFWFSGMVFRFQLGFSM